MLDKNLTFGGVFFMSKYSFEFKLKVAIYLNFITMLVDP